VSDSTAPSSPDAWRLTLDDAVAQARAHNPGYRRAEDAVAPAEWGVREAYGAFLPTVGTSAGMQYVGAGDQRIGIFTATDIGAGTTNYYLSDYGVDLGYQLSGASLFHLSSSRARRDAAKARVRAAGFDLESRVTQQYLAALQARDAVAVARSGLDRAEQNQELVEARVEAGAAPGTDARQAEVERGRAQVALVRARNAERTEKVRLLEVMGVEDARPLELVSDFQVFEPTWTTSQLVDRAQASHPELVSARADERAGDAQVRQAQSAYLPTLSLDAQWSGFTRELGNTDYLLGQARSSAQSSQETCARYNAISAGIPGGLDGYPQDCSQYRLTQNDESRILAANNAFPFDFRKQPISLSLRISLPVFQGFGRQRQVEEAKAAAREAQEIRREEELALRTAITTATGNLDAAYQVVEIEERNRQVAQERLELARERYRVGAAPYLELLDAQSSAAQADRDHLQAVYDFHAALAELERASGQDLRGEESR